MDDLGGNYKDLATEPRRDQEQRLSRESRRDQEQRLSREPR